MKLHSIVAAILISVSLTGCPNVSVTGGVSVTERRTPEGVFEERTISGGFTISNIFGRSSSNGAIDVSDIAIDMTGNGTAVLDNWGAATLLVKEDGAVIGSTPFDYVVMDSMAVAADPAALNAWLANFPSANGFDFELRDVQTADTQQGIASLTVEAFYGSDLISSASSSWTSSAGSGCIPGGDHGNPGGEQPIELPGDGGVGCP